MIKGKMRRENVAKSQLPRVLGVEVGAASVVKVLRGIERGHNSLGVQAFAHSMNTCSAPPMCLAMF